MLMVTALATTLTAAEESLAPTFAPAPVIALISAAVFTILGFVVFSYKNVANRNLDPEVPIQREQPIDEFGHELTD
ncbi:hypothetical protein [Frondihabitans peucedani]|uniref:Uncharacterized protein n=1 Tax=Frondihabitans peucedani TaxID=598626 RepID=A0ABP8E3L0_9MICO